MLRTILFFSGLWLSLFLAIPIGLFCFLFWLIGLGKTAAFIMWVVGRYWAKAAIAATGSRLLVSGLEAIPKNEGVCFVGNHPGDFDLLVALATIPRPFGFTAKKEVLFMPMIGFWVWILGGVLIDRKNTGKAYKAIVAGAERIRLGGAMIIFPEGTRSRGDCLLPFRAGAMKLATLSDAPIVPVAIRGSWRVWEERSRIGPADVIVRYGEAMPTKGLSSEKKRALAETVRSRIAELAGFTP